MFYFFFSLVVDSYFMVVVLVGDSIFSVVLVVVLVGDVVLVVFESYFVAVDLFCDVVFVVVDFADVVLWDDMSVYMLSYAKSLSVCAPSVALIDMVRRYEMILLFYFTARNSR